VDAGNRGCGDEVEHHHCRHRTFDGGAAYLAVALRGVAVAEVQSRAGDGPAPVTRLGRHDVDREHLPHLRTTHLDRTGEAVAAPLVEHGRPLLAVEEREAARPADAG
jgi:hypothetical protein